MLPKKKRKLFVLYSIPIKLRDIFLRFNLCKEKLYLVSYSIPLGCMVALLLLGVIITNPSLSDRSYAIEVGKIASETDENIGAGSNNLDESTSSNADDNVNSDPTDEDYGGNAGDFTNVVVADTGDEYGVMPLIAVAHPEISMAVSSSTGDGYGNTTTGQVETAPGAGTAYRSHKITVTGQDIEAYQLTISGPTNLTPSSGASTVVSGAGGVSGSNMAGNTWGYAWGDNSEEVTGMIYNTVTTGGGNLACTDPNADYTVSCEKKLVFGANFAAGADGGTYTANVTVSLTSTPHLVGQAWSNESGFSLDTGIDDMQDIDKVDGGFCKSTVPAGSTITLRDSRGGVENFYKVTKMQDGTCWMAENLRLKGGTKITSTDSDVKSDWTLPTNASINSSTMNWGSDNNTAYMAEGSTSMKLYSSSGAWKEAYGNYYSWCAATAMSCLTNRTGNAITNTDATESICPKNWKLPAYSGTQSFQNLYNQYPNSTTAGWATNQTISYNGSTSAGYNGLKLGYNSTNTFFPAAGSVHSYGLQNASSDGYYWSRRAYSNTSDAYFLHFSSGYVSPQSSYNRYGGFSVRCVAQY